MREWLLRRGWQAVPRLRYHGYLHGGSEPLSAYGLAPWCLCAPAAPPHTRRISSSYLLRLTAIKCPAITTPDGYALWPEANAGDVVEGTCLLGYEGSVMRTCTGTTTSPGTWAEIDGSCDRTYTCLSVG